MIKDVINKIRSCFLNNSIIIFISFLILLKPYFFSSNHIMNDICNIYMILFFMVIVFFSIFNNKISLYQKILQIFLLLYLISTIFISNDYLTWLKFYIKISTVSLYTELLIKNNLNGFLKIISYLMIFLISLTFITTIIFPNGIYGNEMILLGYDNSTIILLIFGAMLILFSAIYFFKKTNNKKYIVLGFVPFIMVFIIYLIRWSIGALLGCFTIIGLLFIYFFIKKLNIQKIYLKLFNLKNLFILSFCAFFLIIVFDIQKYFSFIIVDVFHKDITLTNRTYIWDICFHHIKLHPLFGMGIMDFESRLSEYGIYHAHSNFLNIILESGIIGLSIYTILWSFVIKSVRYIKENILSIITTITLFSFLVMTIVDVIDNNELFYIFMVIAYFLPYIIDESNKNTRKNEKNNILIVIDSGQPVPALNGGAIETLIDSLIKENEKIKKYNIDVYSTYDDSINKFKFKGKNVNYFYINTKSIIYFMLKCLNYLNKKILKNNNKNVFSIITLYELEIHNKLNYYNKIIIENSPMMINSFKNKIDSEYILHVHNDINNLIYTSESLEKFNKIICCSDFVTNRIKSICNNSNVVTIHNGVNIKELIKYNKKEKAEKLKKQYGISNESIVFGYCGRICEDKGTRELIEAFKLILKNNVNVFLVLTGNSFFKNSNPTPYIESLLDSLKGYENKIIFTGYFDHCEIGKFYSIIDIYVQPSIVNEACPLTIIESQVMNKIIVTTDSGGIPELIKNKNVTIIDRKNLINDLSKEMSNIVNGYPEFKKIKINKKIFDYFDEETYARNMLEEIN